MFEKRKNTTTIVIATMLIKTIMIMIWVCLEMVHSPIYGIF
jgi:hypothetical protein